MEEFSAEEELQARIHTVHTIQGLDHSEDEVLVQAVDVTKQDSNHVTQTSYCYKAIKEHEIRLLSFNIQPDREILGVQMVTAPILSPDAPITPYNCLSYMWGPATATKATILVDGHTLQISGSLARFLEMYQTVCQAGQHLWIDQICIDQSNLPEKNAQVRQMDKIYRQAKEVVVWLGDPLSNSYFGTGVDDKTYGMLNQLERKLWEGALQPWDLKTRPDLEHPGRQDISTFVNNCKSDRADGLTQRLTTLAVDICTNPYWTRCWIVQEFLLGRELVVFYGPQQINRETPHEHWRRNSLQLLINWAELFYKDRECPLACVQFQMLASKIDSVDFGKHSLVKTDRLLHVLELARGDCWDPHDKVYSILGLVRQEQRLIEVDYSCSLPELSRKLLHAACILPRSMPRQSMFSKLIRTFGVPSDLHILTDPHTEDTPDGPSFGLLMDLTEIVYDEMYPKPRSKTRPNKDKFVDKSFREIMQITYDELAETQVLEEAVFKEAGRRMFRRLGMWLKKAELADSGDLNVIEGV